jgi:hypothetical protein
MVDYWTMFSVGIVLNSREEKSWWEKKLEEEPDIDCESSEWEKFEEEWSMYPDDWPGFDYKFASTASEHTNFSVLYAFNEAPGGRPKALAKLMQMFLQKFNQEGCLGLEVSFVCSKPYTDGFGGAAYFITADKIEVLSTLRWLEEKIELFKTEPLYSTKLVPYRGGVEEL